MAFTIGTQLGAVAPCAPAPAKVSPYPREIQNANRLLRFHKDQLGTAVIGASGAVNAYRLLLQNGIAQYRIDKRNFVMT